MNKIYQEKRLPCENDQGFCDATSRTQATIVWVPVDTYTIFQVARSQAIMMKFHQKYFIEPISYDKVNPDKIRQNRNC